MIRIIYTCKTGYDVDNYINMYTFSKIHFFEA